MNPHKKNKIDVNVSLSCVASPSSPVLMALSRAPFPPFPLPPSSLDSEDVGKPY